ncbi:MAG: MarR family transcriptional regulator [Mycobacteriales bacterium]
MQLSPHEVIERELTRLWRSAEHVHRRMHSAVEFPQHLERAAYRMLAHIVERGPVRQSKLAECSGLDTSTVSRQIAALETQGLVMRQSDPADARAVLLAATDGGIQLLTATRESRSRFVRDVVESWPAADRTELARLLTQFNDGVAQSASVRQGVS